MDNQIKPNPFILRIIWFALMASAFVYAGLCFYLHGAPSFAFNFSDPNTLIYILMAFISLCLAFVLSGILLKSSEVKDPIAKYFVPFIVKMALLESVVIFGMVMTFSNRTNFILPFFAAGFIGMALSFPSNDKIRSASRI